MSNEPLSLQYARAGQDWAEKNAAADLLEETKSSVLSQWIIESGEKTQGAKEAAVKASDRWKDYVTKMVAARKAANLAKVKVEYIKMKASEWQNDEANQRAQARL